MNYSQSTGSPDQRSSPTIAVAPHGYDLYYLNTIDGPRRVWRFHNDPAHEWIVKPA